MAVFTALAYFFPATFGAAASWFGLGTRATSALLNLGKTALWMAGSAALARSQVSRQEVTSTLNESIQPRVRGYGRAKLGGVRAFWEKDGSWLHQIIVAHHGQIAGNVSFVCDGDAVTLGPGGVVSQSPYKTDLVIQWRDGSADGGDYSEVRTKFPEMWTADHKLTGQATYYVKMDNPGAEKFSKVWPKGAYTEVQMIADLSLVKDPRTGAIGFSDNAASVILDYLTHPDGFRIPEAQIDMASFSAFADKSDEVVPRKDGSTEPRYRIAGYYSLEDAPKDVLGRMLSVCDAQIYITPEGKIGIFGGGWSVPDVTITSDDVLGIEFADGYDPFTDFNVLKGRFVSPEHGFEEVETAEWRDGASLATQPMRIEELELDLCPSNGQMHRLMKPHRMRSRREIVGTIRTNMVGIKARWPKVDGIHTIRLQIPEWELDGVFEVTSHEIDFANGECLIGFASVWNAWIWAASEEGDVVATTESQSKGETEAVQPTGLVLQQEVVEVSAGVSGVKIVATVVNPSRRDLQLVADVRSAPLGTTDWGTWEPMLVQLHSYRAETGVVADSRRYQVRARWSGQDDYAMATINAVANPAAPAPPTGFNAMAVSTTIYLEWMNPASGFWRTWIYRSETNDFATAAMVGEAAGLAGQSGSHTDSVLSGTLYYYWVVTMNASRVPSAPSGPITVIT